jgi:hypothetical protein
MKAIMFALAMMALSCQISIAQESSVRVPPSPPTIPGDVMFALGQQGGQLTGISTRLEKIETKIEDVQRDVTRINAVGGLATLLVTVILAPIIVYRIQHRLGQKPT